MAKIKANGLPNDLWMSVPDIIFFMKHGKCTIFEKPSQETAFINRTTLFKKPHSASYTFSEGQSIFEELKTIIFYKYPHFYVLNPRSHKDFFKTSRASFKKAVKSLVDKLCDRYFIAN